ncbi:ATP-binding protein [Paucibacter sp. APW11]|uniref:histidine kinase n=1 Tax=Roseateles aquae TaxID=3077235 RepID=A0ABU3PDX9_9BURK|nr:ATP-binding protein [Paucibacter sp. APW11]MDT9000790.1 ATP-binding protein [Paucibacter sp. APW11]
MASDPRRAQALLGLTGLALLGDGLLLGLFWGQPRPVVLAALGGLLLLALGARLLLRLPAQPLRPEPQPSAAQGQAQARQLLLLEGLLDAAPVALWRLGEGVADRELQALNVQARRLLAPGSPTDPEALRQQLLRLPAAPAHLLIELPLAGDGEAAGASPERWLLRQRSLLLAGQPQRLLALMPLESELQAEAQKSWRELVKVLTHEIMNSLTPIASLSRSALEMHGDPAQADDLQLALEAIARRAEALGRFVGDYRQVSEWPAPQLAALPLQPLFERLQQLVGPAWRARGGQLDCAVEPASLMLMADEGQLEQVLLNLLRNAEQATAGVVQPQAQLRARLAAGGRLQITVSDNGPGVPPGLERQIFLPFFSARGPDAQGQRGSGIGLAVVRQLLHGMGGTVRHVRPVQGGACFVISF